MCKLLSIDNLKWLENGAKFRVQEHCCESGGQADCLGQTSRGLKCYPKGMEPCPRVLGNHERGRGSSGCGTTLWGPCEDE